MTPSEEIIDRYKRIEYATDDWGRQIGVRRLRVSQQVKISELTPDLEGFQTFRSKGENGDVSEVTVSRRAIPIIAASVCKIDGNDMPFPRTRGELDWLMDRLDDEGIAAAVTAQVKLNPAGLEKEKVEKNSESYDPGNDDHMSEHDQVVGAAKK
jgi:hypothetical protein